MQLDKGILTISLDFELIWGTLDLFGPERFRRQCEIEREQVVDRLLDLLDEFHISATWCVVGHLFLDHCIEHDGHKHPNIVRPQHSWCKQDWFYHDPCEAREGKSIFLGRSLVEKIVVCATPQEIGCHSFSHVIFGDAGCSRETAESEIAACVELARDMGIKLHSFAFPRNRVGHLDVLRDYGFSCYRGPDSDPYQQLPKLRILRRLAHLWDVLTAKEPPIVFPEKKNFELWNVPGSMIYFPIHGLRRFIPVSRRVKRAIKGLEAAAREKGVFHLWFHPTNLSDQSDAMFAGLRMIFQHASQLREDGKITIAPMRAFGLADVPA